MFRSGTIGPCATLTQSPASEAQDQKKKRGGRELGSLEESLDSNDTVMAQKTVGVCHDI
jgi:hypothetical protein